MSFSKYLQISAIAFLCMLMTPALGIASSPAQGWDEGVAAFKNKDYPAAVDIFLYLSIGSMSQQEECHYMLGLSYEQLKKNKLAKQSLRKAYDLNPNDLSIKVALSRLLVKSEQYKAAYQMLSTEDIMNLKPGPHGISAELGAGLMIDVGVNAIFLYGTSAYKIGKKKEGLDALKLAADYAPDNKRIQKAYKAALEG